MQIYIYIAKNQNWIIVHNYVKHTILEWITMKNVNLNCFHNYISIDCIAFENFNIIQNFTLNFSLTKTMGETRFAA